MIGKPEWFTYRIFGWGIGPRKWQGWAYIAVFLGIVLGISALPLQDTIKIWAVGALIVVLVLDAFHIMFKLSRVHDERQNLQQLMIERNVSFAAVIALVSVALYQSYMNRNYDIGMPFDISILIVLGVMLAVKIASTVYVRMKL